MRTRIVFATIIVMLKWNSLSSDYYSFVSLLSFQVIIPFRVLFFGFSIHFKNFTVKILPLSNWECFETRRSALNSVFNPPSHLPVSVILNDSEKLRRVPCRKKFSCWEMLKWKHRSFEIYSEVLKTYILLIEDWRLVCRKLFTRSPKVRYAMVFQVKN